MNVGLIIHPVDIENVKRNYVVFYPRAGWFLRPVIQKMDDYILKEFITKIPSHRFMDVKVSNNLRIFGIMVPLFPINMVRDKKKAIREIEKAFLIAKDLKIDIVTLAAFTSIISAGGDDLEKTHSVAYTSGNALTAALCIEGIEKALKVFKKPPHKVRVAIIGASGDIGSVCSDYFSKQCKEIVLCSRKMSPQHELCKRLSSGARAKVDAVNDIDIAIRDADVILAAASSFGTIFNDKNLKKGAIICDAGMPPNFSKNVNRNDIFVFDGGKASVEFYDDVADRTWKALFPRNSLFGCFAEALTLALEEKIENYSTGKGNISLAQVEGIKYLANRNGIKLAEFSCGENLYDANEIDQIRTRVGV